MESNDSPEIPDRGETSDIPGLPSGAEIVEHLEDLHMRLMMIILSVGWKLRFSVNFESGI